MMNVKLIDLPDYAAQYFYELRTLDHVSCLILKEPWIRDNDNDIRSIKLRHDLLWSHHSVLCNPANRLIRNSSANIVLKYTRILDDSDLEKFETPTLLHEPDPTLGFCKKRSRMSRLTCHFKDRVALTKNAPSVLDSVSVLEPFGG